MGRALLIIVSGLMIIYGLIQNALNERQNTITEQNVTYGVHTKAETIANTMADMAYAKANQFSEVDTSGYFPDREMMGGRGSVDITFDYPYAPGNPYIQHKIIQATGVFQGDTSRVQVRTQRRPFSRYAYFSIEEDPGVAFVDGNEINGPVHTNDRFYIDGDPVFNGPVSSPEDWLGRNGSSQSGNNPEFNGKTDFGSPHVDVPADVTSLKDEAEDKWRFEGNNYDKIKIEFKEDGTATISTYYLTGEVKEECKYLDDDASGSETCYGGKHNVPTYELKNTKPLNLKHPKFNGLISSSKKIEVKGIVNGNVTVHSEKEVKIIGDLRYKVDPRDDPFSDDFMGIVSEGDVVVDKYAQTDNGETDVDIHASIMAMDDDDSDAKEKFKVEYAGLGEEPRGFINLLGGLIQYKRGMVGESADGAGLSKNYSYDQRLMGMSPRGFPRTDIFDYISWKTLQKTEGFDNPSINGYVDVP